MTVKPDFLSHVGLLKKLLIGDPRCRFQRGDDILLTVQYEGGRHPVGTEGMIIGCLYLEEPIQVGEIIENELYYIVWDMDPVPTIGGGSKIGPGLKAS